MTREEAIGYLKGADVTVGRRSKTKTAEVLEMAIEALENSRWIPVSERLPEKCKSVLICMKGAYGYFINVSYRLDDNLWEGYGRNANVIAWMPLPEPYKGESEEV